MGDFIIILLLILLNGLFSMAEVALISARKSHLSSEAKNGSGAARVALSLSKDPDRFLSTIQIGITLIGILTGLFSGAALSQEFARVLEQAGLSPRISVNLSKILIVVVVTYLSIVIGELVPKRIGLSAADSVAVFFARPMKILSLIAMPAVWLLSKSTNLVVRLFNIGHFCNKVTEEEIKSLIRDGADAGEVQLVEQDIMERTLVMGDERVISIMTARMNLVMMDMSMDIDEIRATLKKGLHDTYPVLDSLKNEVVGVVSMKDLIIAMDSPDFSLAGIVRPGKFFPESMKVYDALEILRDRDVHCGLVCDEYGTLQGIVTLCDVFEGLVGTLLDKQSQPDIIERSDGKSWLVDGQCAVYDFLDYFDADDKYVPSSYTTVAGLLLEHIRHFPALGEHFCWGGFDFEIVDIAGVRINKVLVKRMADIENI